MLLRLDRQTTRIHDTSVVTEDAERLAIPIESKERAVSVPVGAGCTGNEDKHYAFRCATSAALMPSSASPYPTPSSMMRRSFWVMAIRV